MERVLKIAVVSVFCVTLLMASPCPAADENESNFTITIAFGGAIGGIFWFISYSTGFGPDGNGIPLKPALFNISPAGWKTGIPQLKFTRDEIRGCSPYIDIINLKY